MYTFPRINKTNKKTAILIKITCAICIFKYILSALTDKRLITELNKS